MVEMSWDHEIVIVSRHHSPFLPVYRYNIMDHIGRVSTYPGRTLGQVDIRQSNHSAIQR